MKVEKTPLDGILVIEPKYYLDTRGFFLETYQMDRYRAFGIADNFIQDNQSRSTKNILRGLHYTKNKPQAQLLTVMRGKIFDVVVDMRKDSATYGKWFGTELSDTGKSQVYMAPGFAHGFCVLSEVADLHYKVSQLYDSEDEAGLNWADPTVNIHWPIKNPIISERDFRFPYFKG